VNVKEVKSIYDRIWEKLTRGVTDKLTADGVVINKWSPNNLRRLIISPDGVVFQPFITTGTFFREPLGVVDFSSEEAQRQLEKNPTIVSVLYKDRVFSSIEEVVIIPKSPTKLVTLQAHEVKALQRKLNSFKRLAYIIIVKDEVDLKEFVAKNLQCLRDRYTPLAENENAVLGNHVAISVNKDWYKHTALRPQFYAMDEEGKPLSQYFKDVKEKLSNLDSKPLLVGKKDESENKSLKSVENEKKSFSESVKKLATYRSVQVNIIKNSKMSDFKQSLILEYGDTKVKQIKDGFNDRENDEFNALLKRLGLFKPDGCTDDRKLRKILTTQVQYTAQTFINGLKRDYPLFGDKLSKVLTPYLNADDMRRVGQLALLDYRDPINADVVFHGEGVSDDIKQRLIKGINLSPNELVELIQGILFDLNVTKEEANGLDIKTREGQLVDIVSRVQPNLDLVILHDLFVYSNKVKHRMYNSLFGTMGYVTDQPVAERMRLLLKETEDLGEDEWTRCKEILSNLLNQPYKNAFKAYRNRIVNKLRMLDDLEETDNQLRRVQVVRIVVDILEDVTGTDPGRLAVIFAWGKLNDKPHLGGQGDIFSSNPTIRKIFDFSRPINQDYASYLKLIQDLVIKG
jgi:hypothetical protein